MWMLMTMLIFIVITYNNTTIIWENFVMVGHWIVKMTLIKIGYSRFIDLKVSLGLKGYFN